MRFLVGIPVFNEEPYVERVLGEVRRCATDVAVVDDGSTDGSRELLKRLKNAGVVTYLVRHAGNHGYGRALINLFKVAVRTGYEALVTLDCDEQHQPSHIPDFVEAIEGWDIVSGTRYPEVPHEPGDQPPPDRLGINREITARINELTGYGLTDSFCGFKAYSRLALEELKLTESGYGMPLELWVKAAHLGLKVREIPVHRIYKDQTRSFGGELNDPSHRLAYYDEVLRAALEATQS